MAEATPIIIVERRALSAHLLTESFRAAGFAPRTVGTLQAAAAIPQATDDDSPQLAIWIVPNLPPDTSWRSSVRHCARRLRLLAMGNRLRPDLQIELLVAGVAGYVDQRDPWNVVLQAVHQIAAGDRWFSRPVLSAGIDNLRHPSPSRRHGEDPDNLTKREIEIARRVALGETNKQIAGALSLADTTVKTHLQNIFGKMKVSSRVALALCAASRPHRFGLEAETTAARAGR